MPNTHFFDAAQPEEQGSFCELSPDLSLDRTHVINMPLFESEVAARTAEADGAQVERWNDPPDLNGRVNCVIWEENENQDEEGNHQARHGPGK